MPPTSRTPRLRGAAPAALLAVASPWALGATEHVPVPPAFEVMATAASPLVAVDSVPVPAGTLAIAVDEAALATAVSRAVSAHSVVLEDVPLAPGVARSLLVRLVERPDDLVIEVVSDDGTAVPMRDDELDAAWGTIFAGRVIGEPESTVVLAFGPAVVSGFVEEDDHRFVISGGRPGEAHQLVAFDELAIAPELRPGGTWSCFTPSGPLGPSGGPGDGDGGVSGSSAPEDPPCRQLRVAVETDFEYAQLFGGDATEAAHYAILLVAAAGEIDAAGPHVRLGLTYLRLWSTPADPWTMPTPAELLTQFRNHWNTQMTWVEREVAHFLSGRILGGGQAWVGTLCQTNSYSLSSNLNGFFPYPIVDNHPQNWDIFIVTHEIAHNFGAIHTHAHGLLSPDLCGFGECLVGPTATVMSYCHLCPGGVSNIRLRFAPISITTILDYLDSVTACVAPAPEGVPVAVDDFTTAATGEMITIDLLANDAPANCWPIDLASVSGVSEAGGAVTAGTTPGTITYTAPLGFIGEDSIAYTITGGGSSGVGQAFIRITPLAADLNGDGRVNGVDLAALLGSWGVGPESPADLDGSGAVDGADLAILLGSWTG